MSVARPFLALQTPANITTKTIPASNLSHLFQLVQNNKTFLKASMDPPVEPVDSPAEPVPLPALAALFRPIYLDYENVEFVFDSLYRIIETNRQLHREIWSALTYFRYNSPRLRASMLEFGEDGLEGFMAPALRVYYSHWYELWDIIAVRTRMRQWLIDCATHSDSGCDEAVAEALQKFKFMPSFRPPVEVDMPDRYLEHWVPEVAAALDKLLHGSLEGRTEFDKLYGGESYAEPTDVELHSIIREFKRIAVDCAMVWMKYGLDHPNWALCVNTGKSEVQDRARRRYTNPYSDVPMRVRFLMAEVDYEGLLNLFFKHDEWPPLLASMDDVDEIGLLLCGAVMVTVQDFDEKVFSKVDDSSLSDAYRSYLTNETMNRPKFPPQDWQMDSDILNDLPEIPLTRLDVPLQLTDVPLQLTGPPIDPFQVASVHISIPTEDWCPICLEPFEEAPMCLNACSHFLHNGCLAGLINSLQTDSPDYKCPLCRSSICEVRSYKAVLGSRLET